jgi:hypothetical protein
MSAQCAKAQPEQLPFLGDCRNPTTARMPGPGAAAQCDISTGTDIVGQRGPAGCQGIGPRDRAMLPDVNYETLTGGDPFMTSEPPSRVCVECTGIDPGDGRSGAQALCLVEESASSVRAECTRMLARCAPLSG